MRRNDRWTSVGNGIATIAVGFVLFGVGVDDNLGPIQILGGLVIAAGAVTLLIALLRSS